MKNRLGLCAAIAAFGALALLLAGCSGTPKEKVTVRIITEGNTGITTPGVQTDQVAQELEKKTGIVMNVENLEGDQIVPKILAMNASGDLPDVYIFESQPQTLKTLLDSGSVYDLTDIAPKKLTNWYKNPRLKTVLDFSTQFLSDGKNRLYVLPVSNGLDSVGITAGTFIRWDYYKEQGYPKVTDVMDLIPILKKMQQDHPKTAQGKPAWGVSFWTDWAIWPVTVFGFVDGQAEGGEGQYGTIDISNEDFVPLISDSSVFWKYLRFYNKAFQEGILDPDSFTLKQEQWANKITAGQAYFMIPGWMTTAYQGKPDEGFALIDTTGNSDKAYASWGGLIGWQHVVNSKTKVIDAVMTLFNWFGDETVNKMVLNGVQGQTWDMVNGKPKFKDGILKIVDDSSNPDRDKYGYQKYSRLAAALAGGENDSKGMPMNFRFYPDFMASSLTVVEKDQVAYYGIKLPSDLYTRKKYTRYDNALMAAYPANEDKTFVQRQENINNYINDNWIRLVRAKDDKAFEAAKAKFIADLKAMGWDEQLAQFMKVYDETKAKVQAIRKK